ncbi:hypothetical protein I302_104388 [Kwoniella bestiolae CBS 10118]|uniref:Bromo domain-containing protein n=1 Tax=Kwoniella bestiolae CBS 10118 TaxID=1296100 RepID=A0A1B9GB64_9TREE|nr:hypothetical protein I302_03094 [Kwoniella bestiolae CBS 10118]OCF28242.1 hypothetical protein I302_03094 [Kwoniella bestiolae CBS 10118]
MTALTTPKVAPIKIKLSLGSKLANPSPSTPASAPAPAPSTPTLTLTTGGKKGKDKSVQQDEPISTPIGAEGSKKKKGKSKVPPSSTPVNEISLNDEPQSQPQAGPSRITIHNPSSLLGHQAVPTPQEFTATPQAVPSTPTPPARGRPPKTSTSTIKKTQSKSTPRSAKASTSTAKSRKSTSKPSAIPSRLLSESISTPSRPSLPLSETSYETPSNNISLNSSEVTSPDPLSLPLSPSAINGELPSVGTPQQQNGLGDETQTPQSGRGHRTGGKWMRIKRPLKELLNRTLVEMRRKDDYALFEDPVDLEAFPDYLDVIGGEDKMMDMGTMQRKVDSGEYTSVGQMEADLHLLVDAAQKFNPPGTIPYNSAARVLTIGMKHIERSKPLVLTPSPSPTRESATPFGARGYSVFSGREGTAALEDSLRRVEEIQPSSYIPEQMLDFPPNSLQALAVGWNLNGGKRVHAKRVVRSREKFTGKWRHWEMDGTRDIAEMDDPPLLLERWKVDKMDKIVDWKESRRISSSGTNAWWESDTGLSGPSTVAGQPPTPYAAYNPRRDKVVEKDLEQEGWGNRDEINQEIRYIRRRMGLGLEIDDEEVLAEHLRPVRPRLKRDEGPTPTAAAVNLTNIYDEGGYKLGRSSIDWVREMINGGDVRGEAYLSSVSKFVEGAMRGASGSELDSTNGPVGGVNGVEKEDEPPIKQDDDKDIMPLNEYVLKNYHDGVLSKSIPRKVYHQTISHLSKPLDERPQWIRELTSAAYARLALREMTSPTNPLDIKPLLRLENDFLHQGVGARIGGSQGIKMGLEWTGGEIGRLDRELREKIRKEQEERSMAEQKKGDTQGEGKRKREDEEGEDEEGNKKVKLETNLPVPVSATSSPLSSAPGSPSTKPMDIDPKPDTITNGITTSGLSTTTTPAVPIDPGDTASLRKLRLELVALAKFYPLPALKKMRDYEALKLLPFNVRSLMIVPEDLKKAEAARNVGGSGVGVKGRSGK